MKKARYTYNLFDLDGTLTDPAPGITASVAYALERLKRPVPDIETLKKFIGPPLVHSFGTLCGLNEDEARTALAYYRERFSAGGLYENSMYPGVDALLKAIKDGGGKVVLATSKPEEFAVPILKHFGLYEYFDFVAGNTLDESRSEKRQVIAHIENSIPGFCAEEAVMVGDRRYDALAAGEFGIKTIGVLFGYGTRQELEQAGAAEFASSVEELTKLLVS